MTFINKRKVLIVRIGNVISFRDLENCSYIQSVNIVMNIKSIRTEENVVKHSFIEF